jgi:hypothetical protein
MPSWKKVILSGSDAALNSLDVTTNVTATSFTGSLLGTASFATQALSASYAPGTGQTLQQVTDNGSTTTNSITVTGFTSNKVGGDGITGTFRSTNGYNRLLLISTGSTGINEGQVNIILRDSSDPGGFNNDGTISYGGGNTATLSIKTVNDNEIKLQGTTTDHIHSFSDGGTGSLVWNSVVPFIQRTGSGQTQFLGLATSASYVATASYTPTLQQVTNVGNTTTNSIFLSGLWSNTLRIGLEGGATSPAPSQSVGLGLHGSQIYWSGSTPDGGGATPSTNLKAVEQFQYDNNNISVGGKLFVFNGVSIGTGSFHSVHCDYTLFGTNEPTNNVFNVRAGTLIIAVDDANRISSTEYSTAMTSGSQEIDPINFNIERVSGDLQCWISSTNNYYNVCKSRITIM